jgi:hypothetical protein
LHWADHSSRGVLQECGVSKCHREATIMRRPWPTMGCCTTGEGWGVKTLSMLYNMCSRCVKEGSILASVCGASMTYIKVSGM